MDSNLLSALTHWMWEDDAEIVGSSVVQFAASEQFLHCVRVCFVKFHFKVTVCYFDLRPPYMKTWLISSNKQIKRAFTYFLIKPTLRTHNQLLQIGVNWITLTLPDSISGRLWGEPLSTSRTLKHTNGQTLWTARRRTATRWRTAGTCHVAALSCPRTPSWGPVLKCPAANHNTDRVSMWSPESHIRETRRSVQFV